VFVPAALHCTLCQPLRPQHLLQYGEQPGDLGGGTWGRGGGRYVVRYVVCVSEWGVPLGGGLCECVYLCLCLCRS